jgi:hypothetical protein
MIIQEDVNGENNLTSQIDDDETIKNSRRARNTKSMIAA